MFFTDVYNGCMYIPITAQITLCLADVAGVEMPEIIYVYRERWAPVSLVKILVTPPQSFRGYQDHPFFLILFGHIHISPKDI